MEGLTELNIEIAHDLVLFDNTRLLADYCIRTPIRHLLEQIEQISNTSDGFDGNLYRHHNNKAVKEYRKANTCIETPNHWHEHPAKYQRWTHPAREFAVSNPCP